MTEQPTLEMLWVVPRLPAAETEKICAFLKALSQASVAVDCVVPWRSEKPTAGVVKYCRYIFEIKAHHNILGRLKNAFFFRPLDFDQHFQNELAKIMKANRYDLIQAQGLTMAPYLDNVTALPVVIDLWSTDFKGGRPSDKRLYEQFSQFLTSTESKKFLEENYPNKKAAAITDDIAGEAIAFYRGIIPKTTGNV